MRLTYKKYIKVLNLAKEHKFSSFDLITNYGLFSGDRNLWKTLKVYEFLKSFR